MGRKRHSSYDRAISIRSTTSTTPRIGSLSKTWIRDWAGPRNPLPYRAILEYRSPITAGNDVTVRYHSSGESLSSWFPGLGFGGARVPTSQRSKCKSPGRVTSALWSLESSLIGSPHEFLTRCAGSGGVSGCSRSVSITSNVASNVTHRQFPGSRCAALSDDVLATR